MAFVPLVLTLLVIIGFAIGELGRRGKVEKHSSAARRWGGWALMAVGALICGLFGTAAIVTLLRRDPSDPGPGIEALWIMPLLAAIGGALFRLGRGAWIGYEAPSQHAAPTVKGQASPSAILTMAVLLVGALFVMMFSGDRRYSGGSGQQEAESDSSWSIGSTNGASERVKNKCTSNVSILAFAHLQERDGPNGSSYVGECRVLSLQKRELDDFNLWEGSARCKLSDGETYEAPCYVYECLDGSVTGSTCSNDRRGLGRR